MNRALSRAPIGAALASALAALTACQSYQPRPLAPQAHRDDWHGRTPADEPVRALAQRLAETGAPGPFDPADGLGPREAEIVALVYNPDLRLARLRAGVARATADHAGLWDDPELSVDALRITESVPNPWIVGASLAITLPISGRLAAERARADAALAAELQHIVEQEWSVRSDVRRAWLTYSAARLRIEQLESLIASMESLVSSTAQLAEAGEMLRTEASLFTIERLQRQTELRRMQGRLAEAEQSLHAIMGLSPDAPLSLVPRLQPPPPPGDVPDNSPSLAHLRAQYELAEQTLRREIRKQHPDLTIGPAYESDEGQSKIGLVGVIPIPILNANRQGIAEAAAQRELARAEFETEYERLAGALAAATARADSLSEQRELIVAELVPLADRQLADARRLLELGEGGGLVLLESLVRAHEIKLQLIDAQLGEALALADIARITGPRAQVPPADDPPAPTPDRSPDPTQSPDELTP